MKPFCQLFAGGIDLMGIAGGLSSRLLSVDVTDEAEDKSDRISIRLDDRARFSDSGVVSVPLVGTVVTAVMGYSDGSRILSAANRGSFLIDQITVSSPPRTLTVTGRSAAMNTSFRTPRTQSYHQKPLGDIMNEIAGRGGFSAVIDPDLASIIVRHVDQHNESDMAFATRIAGMHDAAARPVAGRLVVAKKGTGAGVGGVLLPSLTLTEQDCESWDFQYSAREEAGQAGGLEGGGASGGVRAFWTDVRTGEKKEVTGGNEPYHDLRFTYHNEAEAMAAVSQKLNEAARGKSSFSCTTGGKPEAQAEAQLILAGFRPYIPFLWRTKSVVHTFDGSAYKCKISAELFAESQDDVKSKVSGTKPTKDDLIDEDAPEAPTSSGGGGFIIDAPE